MLVKGKNKMSLKLVIRKQDLLYCASLEGGERNTFEIQYLTSAQAYPCQAVLLVVLTLGKRRWDGKLAFLKQN